MKRDVGTIRAKIIRAATIRAAPVRKRPLTEVEHVWRRTTRVISRFLTGAALNGAALNGAALNGAALKSAPQRSGFTMLELTAAAAVLGTVFLVAIPLLSRVRDTREDARQRFIAQQEAANVMERLSLRAMDGTLDDAVAQTRAVSPEAKAVLPDADVSVTREAQPDDGGSVRVTVAVSWLNNVGERTVPVSLDAWFPAAEDQP